MVDSYTATYNESDVAPMTIDIGLKILVGIGTLATVLGLVLVWRFFSKKKRM